MVLINILVAIAIIVIIYLFLIMPSFKKPDCSRLLGWNYAHRGLFDNVFGPPENTIAAFENAIIMGYGIELDVRMSKDGVLVVHHDPTLRRTCKNKKRVSDVTAKELANMQVMGLNYGIPTLEKVLKIIDGQVPIIIEIKAEKKTADTVIALRELLMGYNGAFCVQSFSPIVLLHTRRLMPEVIRGQLSTDFAAEGSKKGTIPKFFASNLMTNFLSRPHFISYGYRYNNKLSFKICASRASFTAGWTIKNNAALLRTLRYFDIAIFEGFSPEKKGR